MSIPFEALQGTTSTTDRPLPFDFAQGTPNNVEGWKPEARGSVVADSRLPAVLEKARPV